jgi:hypothetical protein
MIRKLNTIAMTNPPDVPAGRACQDERWWFRRFCESGFLFWRMNNTYRQNASYTSVKYKPWKSAENKTAASIFTYPVYFQIFIAELTVFPSTGGVRRSAFFGLSRHAKAFRD